MTIAKAFVTGSIVKGPEKRFTQNDMAIADFSLSIENNADNVIRVITYGALAESITATAASGDMVAVDGRLQINSFKLPNGKDKRIFEISASSVEKLGATSPIQPKANSADENIVKFNDDTSSVDLIDEEEIPF
ncbi:single-stranded DNA-binding protein [bacterium]|nr:single-stranded DNA-binding protein [bacterium]